MKSLKYDRSMKKYYSLLILLFALLLEPLHSQSLLHSDTLFLKTGHQQFSFDLESSEYSELKLYLYIHLHEGCNFQSGEFISLQMDNQYQGSEIEKVEFARVYLPSYLENKHTYQEIIYKFDMILWQKWLINKPTITLAFSGNAYHLQASLSLEIEKGSTPVNVLDIIPLWQNDIQGFPYESDGNDEMSTGNQLPKLQIQLPKETSNAFVNILISGHQEHLGKNQQTNKFYFLKIDGQDVAKRSIWRNDCGFNPIYPQHENWHDERPNWCPGLRVNPMSHFLSDKFIAKKQLEISLDFQKTFKETGLRNSYITSAVIFALSSASEKLNVSVTEIMAPNMDLWHHRYNPICGSPIILIQNNGQETVHSITFNYGYNFQTDNKYRWKGELEFMEEELVYLPSLNWYF
ncbi:MAG: hypothetical protein GQ527_09070, partial [Bacteroidales bacterium]|nr:hypothetical protein [Bacteroidales bacterium]